MARANTTELGAALQNVLTRHFGTERWMAWWERAPSPFRSSFGLEELAVGLEDGTKLHILFKDLGRHSLDGEGQRVKPISLYDPLREIETYRQILSAQELGTAVCYGAIVNPAVERYWLFLEKVAGRELYRVGDLASWQQAACWLAGLHARLAEQAGRLARQARLVVYDADFYRLWPQRALAFLAANGEARHALERLVERYDRAVERLLALPSTVIHGEFYAANVLIAETASGPRVCPVDWEMAAYGPGLIDLAALTSGKWADDQKDALARAYHTALGEAGAEPPAWEDFVEALAFCRLHLACQWLGWAPDWSPPPEQAQDWLGEARLLAEQLGL
jgi:thiamine kinase-like enzyme